MCGIFGFSKLTEQTRAMAPFLAWAMEERGSHSWGATDGNLCLRHLGPISATFEIPNSWEQGIFHTRFATHGAKTVENAHPFDFGRVKGIHNGTLSNHEELNRMFNRNFEVDSMHLFANIQEGKDLSMISGSASIAYYIDQTLHLCMVNSNNIEIAKLPSGEIVFCSTRTPILKAAAITRSGTPEFFTIHSDKIYRIDVSEDKHKLIDSGEKYTFKAYTYNHSGNSSHGHYPGGHYDMETQRWVPESKINLMPQDQCIKCKWTKVEKHKVLCEKCFKIYEEYIAEFNALEPKKETALAKTNNFIRGFLHVGSGSGYN